MKKSLLYIPALALAAFGLFAAFSDPTAAPAAAANLTDEQKVEAAYQAKVAAFNATKDAECKTTALADATAQFQTLSEAAIAAAAAVPVKGGKKGTTKPATTSGTQTTTTTTTTTTKPVDPQKDRGGATTTTNQKDRGGATTTTNQKERGGATKTTGGN